LAQCGVMVFFVLSGFLIAKSISSNIVKNQGQFSLMKYIGDRVIRIWPPLLFSVILVILLCHAAHLIFPSDSPARQRLTYKPIELVGAAVALNNFFTDNPAANGPLWSLSIEVWYYITAAIMAVPRRWWKLLSLPILLALFIVGWNNDQFFYYLPVWWGGYLLAVLHDRRILPFSKYLWMTMGACLLAAAAFGAHFLTLENIPGAERKAWHFLVFFNVAVGFLCCTILALVLRGNLTLPIIFKPAAAYSYTLYIIHVPVMLFVIGIAEPWIQGALGASLVVAIGTVLGVIALSRWVAVWLENRNLIRLVFFRILMRKQC
jgi:peptidoglycan/LPS O-acetylase OafA/YrhL